MPSLEDRLILFNHVKRTVCGKTEFGFSGTVGGDESDPFGDSYEVDLPPEYFHFQVRRGTYFLYVLTANCPLDVVEKYEPIFEAWHASVTID